MKEAALILGSPFFLDLAQSDAMMGCHSVLSFCGDHDYSISLTVRDSIGRTQSVSVPFSVSTRYPMVLTDPAFAPVQTTAKALAVTRQASLTGGTAPIVWSVEDAPAWLAVNASTGAVGGVIAAPGDYRFTLVAPDRTGERKTAAVAIPARDPLSMTAMRGNVAFDNGAVSCGNTPRIKRGTPVTVQTTIGGGAPPYVWSFAGSSETLSRDDATGVVSWAVSPTALTTKCNYAFIRVTDSLGTSILYQFAYVPTP